MPINESSSLGHLCNKKDGSTMHFDILAPEDIKDTAVIYGYGMDYLKSKGQEGQSLTLKECRFCHVETVLQLKLSNNRKKDLVFRTEE